MQEGEFGIPAKIREVTYLGAGWRVMLELSDGQTLMAGIPRGHQLAGSLTPDTNVLATWSPDSVAVLPTES